MILNVSILGKIMLHIVFICLRKFFINRLYLKPFLYVIFRNINYIKSPVS